MKIEHVFSEVIKFTCFE